MIHRGFAVLGGGPQRHKDGLSVVGPILGQQTVVTTGQPTKFGVRLFKELQDVLREVVTTGHDPLHVVLLVLNRTEEHWVGEIDHPRHATTGRSVQRPLCLGRALDDVIRIPEELTYQF